MIRVSREQHRAVRPNYVSQESQDAIEREIQVELIKRAVHKDHVSTLQTQFAGQNFGETAFGKFWQARQPGTFSLFLFANYRLVSSRGEELFC